MPDLRIGALHRRLDVWCCARLMSSTKRAGGKQPKCKDCYFRCNLLCALELEEACPTFRPDGPAGLQPPRQMRFEFRTEQRKQRAFAFPSASEQALLHS